MLSYDYNHFEISLSADNLTLDEVDMLRKDAQRLADKAVKQYKIAKEAARKQYQRHLERLAFEGKIKQIKEKPESEWTAEEKAKVKAFEDAEYWEEYRYNYDDEDFDDWVL